jgi:hypothetical protein
VSSYPSFREDKEAVVEVGGKLLKLMARHSELFTTLAFLPLNS